LKYLEIPAQSLNELPFFSLCSYVRVCWFQVQFHNFSFMVSEERAGIEWGAWGLGLGTETQGECQVLNANSRVLWAYQKGE